MPLPCEPGDFQDLTGQTSCKSCSSQGYTKHYSLFGATTCHPCPAGYECPATDQVPKICKAGTYSAAGDTSCSACSGGYTCHGGATQAAPSNQLCPYGVRCDNSVANGLVESVCGSGGRHIQVRGAYNGSNDCQDCTAGYYCPKGTSEMFLCPTGHYCDPNVDVPSPCAAGTYNPTYGATGSGSTWCLNCPQGYYCPAGTTAPIKCPSGKVCGPNSTQIPTTTCAPGEYSGGESIGDASTDCQTCPKGHYCPEGAIFPTPCPQGKYQDQTGTSSEGDCKTCSEGRVCPYLGNQFGDAVSLPCEPGYPCPAGTKTFYEHSCDAGYYSDMAGIVDKTDTSQC